mmetsp:Transcript_7332/g.20855  ORF Transcript_7332/g.20855 Transcript_7332/m.20855 type:complete len:364 (-) Transcript_7332:562-1653(-)
MQKASQALSTAVGTPKEKGNDTPAAQEPAGLLKFGAGTPKLGSSAQPSMTTPLFGNAGAPASPFATPSAPADKATKSEKKAAFPTFGGLTVGGKPGASPGMTTPLFGNVGAPASPFQTPKTSETSEPLAKSPAPQPSTGFGQAASAASGGLPSGGFGQPSGFGNTGASPFKGTGSPSLSPGLMPTPGGAPAFGGVGSTGTGSGGAASITGASAFGASSSLGTAAAKPFGASSGSPSAGSGFAAFSSTGGGFGSMGGSPNAPSGGGFGASQPAFGQQAAPGFGGAFAGGQAGGAPPGGAFGGAAPTSGGFGGFGQAGSGGFGAAAAPGTGGFSGFGGGAAPAGGAFGSSTPTAGAGGDAWAPRR